MLTLRKAEDRGKSDLGWLKSYHTFSFGGYSDPNHMGFRALRVLNDDRVAAGKGFGAHGHRDMEILSYVLQGQLAHKDSMGEEHVLGPNEVQAMSAGSVVIEHGLGGELRALSAEPRKAHQGCGAQRVARVFGMRREQLQGASHQYLTRGSTRAFTMSTSRLISTTASAKTVTIPCTAP